MLQQQQISKNLSHSCQFQVLCIGEGGWGNDQLIVDCISGAGETTSMRQELVEKTSKIHHS